MTDEDGEPESIPLSDLRADLQGEDAEGLDRADEGTDASEGKKATEGDDSTETGDPDSAPLSGLRDAVDRRARDDPDRERDAAEDAFMEETVEPVDTDGVWADLLMEDTDPEGQFEATETEAGPEGRTQVISKRICERCRYLQSPPILECTHEGTTIHELVDVDHVRVSACPMVGPDGEKTRPDRGE
ncbi:MAG: hypothetical protein ABEJ84_08070 [Halodesulfurarchaeum sp.]